MVGIEFGNTLPKTTVTDCTHNGVCSQCGGCCTNHIALTKNEIKIIQRYIKTHNIQPHIINGPFANPTIDLTCPFLDMNKTTNRCKIYPVRPYICQCFICSDLGSIQRYTHDVKFQKEKRISINMRETFFPK